jgi:hypothetical protein
MAAGEDYDSEKAGETVEIKGDLVPSVAPTSAEPHEGAGDRRRDEPVHGHDQEPTVLKGPARRYRSRSDHVDHPAWLTLQG